MGLILALVMHVALLGDRDQFAQDLDIGFAMRLAADQDLDDLLEIEEPEGKCHVLRRDDLRPFVERLLIFAMDVEQHDMGLRVLLEDAPEDQRHRAGFAGTGGAQHGEMLAEQFVDLHHRRDGGILLDMADADGGVGIAGIGLRQFVLAGAEHHIAERGIGRDAAPERFRQAVLVHRQFADELDLDDPELLVVLRMRRHRRTQRRDERQRC